MALYVYAIARAEAGKILELRGILGQPVYPVARAALMALVSDCRLAAVRPERRHIAASQAVLARLAQQFDLLPMAFGTLTQSLPALQTFLDQQGEQLSAALQHVAGSIEMGLRLSLDVPDPIRYLVEHSSELKTARERMFRRNRVPSYEEKIWLGQLCDSVLQRQREAQGAQLAAMIAPSCTELRPTPARGENEIARFAMLVPRDGLGRFEAAVSEVAAQFDDDYAFSVSGPWPPHNFVQLNLHTP